MAFVGLMDKICNVRLELVFVVVRIVSDLGEDIGKSTFHINGWLLIRRRRILEPCCCALEFKIWQVPIDVSSRGSLVNWYGR